MEACDAMLCNVIWCNVKGVNLAVATTTVASDATHATMQLDSWLKEAEKYGAGKDEVVFTVCANKVDEKNRLVSQECVCRARVPFAFSLHVQAPLPSPHHGAPSWRTHNSFCSFLSRSGVHAYFRKGWRKLGTATRL